MTTALATQTHGSIKKYQAVGNELTNRIGQVLDGKFQHRNQDGTFFSPSIQSALIWPGIAHAVIIDPTRLWHFNIAEMTSPNTLRAMTLMVGKPVRAIDKIPTQDGERDGLAFVTLLNDALLIAGATSPALEASRSTQLPKMAEMDFLKQRPEGDYMIGFGVSDQGLVWGSLTDMTHLIVAGSSDSGKSAFIRSLLYQLANQPLPVELYLTDMEGLTFSWAEGWPILKAPIAETVEAATKITGQLMVEMDHRSRLYKACGQFPEKWTEYRAATGQTLPWLVAIFEEFSALAEQAGKNSRLMQNISQLTMRSRKYGITLVFAGQDFKADLIATRSTNQVKTRVQFRCATREQSESVLEVGGAEKLVEPGRAFVRMYNRLTEIQAFWVPKSVVLGDAQPVDVGRTEPEQCLTLEEFRLTQWTLDHPDQFRGGMQQNKLIEAFDREEPLDGGQRIPARQIVRTVLTSLKSRGLLARRFGCGVAYYVTDELTEMVRSARDAKRGAVRRVVQSGPNLPIPRLTSNASNPSNGV